MSGTVVEVVHFELETDRDYDTVDVVIKLRRRPAQRLFAGSPPSVDDVPHDFYAALVDWTETRSEEAT